MELLQIITVVATAIIFTILGFFLKSFILMKKKNFVEVEIQEKKLEAIKQAEKIKEEAKAERKKKENELLEKEKRLLEKDNFLLEERKKIDQKVENFLVEKRQLKEKELKLEKDLQDLIGMDKTQVLKMLQEKIEKDNQQDLFIQMRKLENLKKEYLENKAGNSEIFKKY